MCCHKYNIQFLLTAIMALVFFSSCIDETTAPEEEPVVSDDKVQLELFTRIDPYNIPNARSMANEYYVDTKPWILVFKGNDAKFAEAVQVIEVSGINKRYAVLTKQSEPCWLLILANPQDYFYTSATQSYTYSVGTLGTALQDKSLSEACRMLRTQPLNNPQTTIPFVNATNSIPLPMSHVEDLPDGINESTKIGSSTQQIELTRAVARAEIVDNSANSRFDFKGITMVANASRQGLLHNFTGTLENIPGEQTEYRHDASYSADIAQAVLDGTEKNTTASPVYLYEAKDQSDIYLIIRATYDGEECFYKLAIVDGEGTRMDIKRNQRYIFNITHVRGIGYYSVADAKESLASNTNLDYTITVRDESSYEISSNNDYYMGVSNSHYIVYGDVGTTREFHAFTLSTDCIRPFPDKRTITVSPGLTLTNPGTNELPIVTNTSPEKTEIKLRLDAAFSTGTVKLELGNLDKTINIERRDRLSRLENTLTFPEFYCLSGYVEEDDAKNWIQLHSSSGARDVTDQIIVEDGVIKIYVTRNSSGKRYGTVYLTTIQNPGTSASHIVRIKIYITQQEVINV